MLPTKDMWVQALLGIYCALSLPHAKSGNQGKQRMLDNLIRDDNKRPWNKPVPGSDQGSGWCI